MPIIEKIKSTNYRFMDIPEYDQLSREQLLQVKKDLTKIVNESSKCLLEVTRMLDNWTEGE